MQEPEGKNLYIFDQQTADRFSALIDILLTTFQEILEARRVMLPDDHDIGIAEMTFYECHASQFDRPETKLSDDLDEIF
ncbi:MAG: hypothetical protein AB7T49_19965 [Oligoflexales bacterium]